MKIIFGLLFILIQGIFSQLLEEPNMQFLGSFAELMKKLEQNPYHLSLVVATRSDDCVKCVEFHEEYERYLQFTSLVVKSFVLDCKQAWKNTHERSVIKICDPENQDKLPSLQFYVPSKKIYNPYDDNDDYPFPEEVKYDSELDAEHMVGTAYQLMPDYTTALESVEEIEEWKQDTSTPLKVLFFSNKEEVTHDWKGLSSEFRLRVDIGIVSENCTDVMNHFEIEEAPHILIDKWDKKTEQYRNIKYRSALRFESLRAFLNMYAPRTQKQVHFSKFSQELDTSVKVNKGLEDFEKKLKELDETWVLLHIKKTGGEDHPQLQNIKKEFGQLFQYHELKCDEGDDLFCEDNIKDKLKIQKFPSLLVYTFGTKQLEKFIKVGRQETPLQLAHGLLEYISVPEREMDDRIVPKFIQKTYEEDKFPCIWFYSTDSSEDINNLIIHTLSNIKKFSELISFGKYLDPDENTRKLYRIQQEYPTVIGYAGQQYADDDIRKERPQQKTTDFKSEFTYENLYAFLSELSEYKEAESLQETEIQNVTTFEQLEQKCINNGNPCMIGLLNTQKPEQLDMDQRQLRQFRVHLKKQKYNWLWIDGACHTEVLSQFNLSEEDLPFFVYYDPRRQKYKAYVEHDFTMTHLAVFHNRLTKKKFKGLKTLDEQLELDERDCQNILKDKRDQLNKVREQRRKNINNKEKDDL